MDLERELSCSICKDLLYQPLTLIDCLHSFCGSCLKLWFSHQATAYENASPAPAPDVPVYTCPSCRARVRSTKHNATVASLLDMVLQAHPDKARTKAEKEEIATKYKPGDEVLRALNIPERTAEELRLEEEDRRLIDEVRQISLSEVGVGSSRPPRSRRRGENRSADGRISSSRDASRDRHHRTRQARDGSRPPRSADRRHRSDQLLPDGGRAADGERRHRRSESRRRDDESSDSAARRQVEHQSSLRSLISPHDMSERDFDREIEDFARQIQEEGLLDGLDLDNLDISRNDELSRKITEAYRRRHRERSRTEAGARRSNASAVSQTRPSELQPPPSSHAGAGPDSRSEPASRPTSRQRPHSRSASAMSGASQPERPSDDRSRPLLGVHPDEQRRRRRTPSGGRSATTPAPPTAVEPRVASRRSQTDLVLRTTRAGDSAALRPVLGEDRSSSSPVVATTLSPQHAVELPTGDEQSVVHRVPRPTVSPLTPPAMAIAELPSPPSPRMQRATRPADLAIVSTAAANPIGSPTSPGHPRPRSRLFHEPSIACNICARPHIEYELHYNCGICAGGSWNLCLDCYRRGSGCLHWFGFGRGAWAKWERRRAAGEPDLERPHLLWASRYAPPRITPGGADGRRTLTTDDPARRLESGGFCARCLAWANDCYWRCDDCNEGDWGFCNSCVNQGRCCTHALLPMTYAPDTPPPGPPASSNPPSPRLLPAFPRDASLLSGPGAASVAPFKPLAFHTRCQICRQAIPPTQERYHCFSCASALDPEQQNPRPGDYDICSPCYAGLVARKQISAENGSAGWRRCLVGHRMVVVAFEESARSGLLRRVVARDLVGGRKIMSESFEPASASAGRAPTGLTRMWWPDGDGTLERLVTKDVAARAPTSVTAADGAVRTFATVFPPDGGAGETAVARWTWNTVEEDELLFPKGAEIREVEDVSGEWFHGCYMGDTGLFPAPYVVKIGNES